ncbi:galectin-4-like [Lampetra fluviatilis]
METCTVMENPILPVSLPIRLYPGYVISVEGRVPEDSERFAVNLCAAEDVALHVNPRWGADSGSQCLLVLNSRAGGTWGREERLAAAPWCRETDFKLSIAVDDEGYKVLLCDSSPALEFAHRCALQTVDRLELKPTAHVSLLRVLAPACTDEELPPPVTPDSGDLSLQDAVSNLTVADTPEEGGPEAKEEEASVKQEEEPAKEEEAPAVEEKGSAPEEGGAGQEAEQEPVPEEEKPGPEIAAEEQGPGEQGGEGSGAAEGDLGEEAGAEVAADAEGGKSADAAAAVELSVPHDGVIDGGLHPGWSLTLEGSVPAEANRFAVNLIGEGGQDIALHVNPRFSADGGGALVRNAKIGGAWGAEEREGVNPFTRGETFTLELSCGESNLALKVGGEPVCEFAHRVGELASITAFHVEGDVTLTAARQGDL